MTRQSETAANLVRAAARAAGLGQRTDVQLLADFVEQRDPSAFEALVRRHGPVVMSACRQVLRDEAAAEDAFQSTFIALYQRASKIRDPQMLAGWLFRVARRSANNTRRSELRRSHREAARAVQPAPANAPDLSWREAVGILHEELDRLPEPLRLALIHCYLQGLSRDEAARRLGWSLNELRGRLERGRARLQKRLQSRGITLSAGLLATLGANALSAGLVAATVAGARSSPLIPASLFPWKAVMTFVVAATVVIGVVLQLRAVHAQPPVASSPPPVVQKKSATAQTQSGRVLDPDGKPVAGADVIVRMPGFRDAANVVFKADADGRFSLPVSDHPVGPAITIAATANGLAAGWVRWDGQASSELTITLARDDIPIRGRVLDLEGKPIGGSTVRVDAVHAVTDGGSKAYLQWVAGRRGRPLANTFEGAPPGVPRELKTDAEGRFEIRGVGRDRVARLLVSGPGIAYEHISVATVREFEPESSALGKAYPATFNFVSAPARPIRGVVRDSRTGKPVPGVRVNGYGGVTDCVTDSEGRYELPGYRKGPRYTVYTWPKDGSTYFPAMAEANDIAGLEALEINMKMQAGVPITGRIRDTATGKPIAAQVKYFALAGNTNVTGVSIGEKPGEFFAVTVKTREDGSFTCAALPGGGFLAITANSNRYPSARVDPKGMVDESVNPPHDADQLRISIGGAGTSAVYQERYQGIVLLKVDKAKPPGELRIDLTPAEPIRGRLVDPAGKPLTGVRIRGLSESGDDWSAPLPRAEFVAVPPHPDRPRRLAFQHESRKLVGTAVVAAGSEKPVDFRLEQASSLKGRLVDENGKPLARVTIHASGARGAEKHLADIVRFGNVFTDADGRFQIEGLLPGVAYELHFREMKPRGRGGPVTKLDGLKPGEDRDLGELNAGRP